ncbi:MAG: hypothetical protein ACREXK_08455 [Gammaproteobacteria bacterium]
MKRIPARSSTNAGALSILINTHLPELRGCEELSYFFLGRIELDAPRLRACHDLQIEPAIAVRLGIAEPGAPDPIVALRTQPGWCTLCTGGGFNRYRAFHVVGCGLVYVG